MRKYRADIDGLRALAVLFVLFFHVGIGGISGGFIGVDIFFVISGYLITAIITRDIDQGQFSLLEFYERRLRRIMPAFIAVAIFTLVVASICFMPTDFSGFGKSLFGTSFYASNIIFWREAGYFDASKWVKPLLHTWSLSVEEQFYVIFPLVMLVIGRFFRSWLRPLIALGLICSFSISVAFVALDKQAFAFYMLPSRAWELLIGAALAVHLYPKITNKTGLNLLSLLGVALMVGSGLFLTSDYSFPGVNALYPTIGAALFIYTGALSSQTSWANTLFSNRVLVPIGKISYSLYLWHWPFIIFTRYITDRPLLLHEKLMIIGASFVMAYVSWFYIEQPFRDKKILPTRSKFLISFFVCSIFLAVMGITIKDRGGFPERFGEPLEVVTLAASQYNPLREFCYHRGTFPSDAIIEECYIGELTEEEASVLIVGDSHADSFTPLIDVVLKGRRLKGLEITSTACPPLLGAHIDVSGAIFQNQSKSKFKKCHAFNKALYKYIAGHKTIKTVILSARWGYYTKNVSINMNEPDQNIFLYDEEDTTLSVKNSERVFAQTLNVSAAFLNTLERNIIIIAPVPEATQNIPECMSKQIVLRKPPCQIIKYEDFINRQSYVLERFDALRSDKIFVYKPHLHQCVDGVCITNDNGMPLYYDDDHLSVGGALYFKNHFTEFLNGKHVLEESK
jgi:peptidoglycan/LPS O-acetylase OafA/YrhL